MGYLVGSLPIGFLLVYLFKGEDLRRRGSGRTGGTNAMRAAGIGVGLLTAAADIAKGAGAVWIARALFASSPVLPWLEASAGAAAVAGHNWSLFLRFKGGAGTAPSLGAAIALWPALGLALIPAGLIVLVATGYASAGSIFVALAMPAGLAAQAAAGNGSWAYAVYGLFTAALVLGALSPNIRRLRSGTERKVGSRAKEHRAEGVDLIS